MQAFFLPTAEELHRWTQAHPQYRPTQHLALAAAIADFQGMRKKDRANFIASMEALLANGHDG